MNSGELLRIVFYLYLGATLVQLAVWWGVFARLAFAAKNETGVADPDKLPPASVVICARNEADNLKRNLPGILAQVYPAPWELVVVDDASDDETHMVLQAFAEQNTRLRVIRIDEKIRPGKKHALSRGVDAARYDHIFLTDADCRPASGNWLAHLAARFSLQPDIEIVLGYAPMQPAPGAFNRWVRFETAYTAIQYLSFALAGMPYMGVGRNMAWKKSLYKRAGGFEAHMDLPSGDDDLLVNAAAGRGNVAVCLHPESFVYSPAKRNWRDWSRQKHRHLSAGKRYRPGHQVALAMLSLSHTLHYFLLLVLLIAGFGMVTVALCCLLRSFSLLFLYGKILTRLREFHLLSQVPIYDALLAVHYGAFVPISLINNQHAHTWK